MSKSKLVKSVTPKYTLDWYLKWAASTLVLTAMSMRGVEGYAIYDLSLSTLGIMLWLWVSLIWNDRALILLNGVGLIFLLKNLALTMA